MWILRDLEKKIAASAKQRPVVVLTGARQTGKTSLVRKLFPKHNYISLDLPSEAESAEKSPQAFLKEHPTPLIIDEVQYAPSIFRYIKLAVDNDRKNFGQFILTGSQKFLLMHEVGDSLAGRAQIIDLEPLSIKEILRSNKNMDLKEIILRGGYPELYSDLALKPYDFYRSYIATYLERDLRSVLQVSSLRDFQRFMRACALRSAQLLNKAEISRDVGISPSTAGEWLSTLEASNQVTLLEPWFSNRTKSLVKTPKFYFNDTGTLLALLDIKDLTSLTSSPQMSAIWETFVLAQIRRFQIAEDLSCSVNFWRDRNKEVDFLIHLGGRFKLYDAKWTEHPKKSDITQLDYVQEALGSKNILARAIICPSKNAYPIENNVKALPITEI